MDIIKLKELIAKGEDSTTEFKEEFLTDIDKTLVAYANDYGGYNKGFLLIGVDKLGNIIGIEKDKIDETQQRIAGVARNNCQPPIVPKIETVEYESKNVIVVEVEQSPNRPHRVHGICYIRVLNTNHKATHNEELELSQQVTRITYDETLVKEATDSDLDYVKFMNYYKETRSTEVTLNDERVPKVLAEHLNFLKKLNNKLYPTVTGILLFGKNPQKYFPLSSINAIRFRGTDLADDILDRKEIKGTCDSLIEESAKFITSYSTIGYSFGETVRRLNILEYPSLAIRESMANAVIHRDYSNPGFQIDLYMFDDRIEIKSPGGLGGGLTKEDLGTGKRYLRNPNIATILYELRYIEKAGTGIPRIKRVMSENGSPNPIFEVDSNSVKVVLKAHPDYVAKRNFEEGLLSKDRGEIDKARTLFREAIKIRDDYAEVYIAWGSLEGEQGNIDRARELYKIATEKSTNNSYSYFNWAILEDRHGNAQGARDLYKKASEISPENGAIWHSWAVMERRLGNLPRATDFFKKATQVRPEEYINWQSLGQIEFKKGSYTEAENYLNRALIYAKEDFAKAWIYCDLARTLDKLRRPKAEIETIFKRSIEFNPNSAETHHYYSIFLNNQGRNEQAYAEATTSKRLGWREIRKYTPFRRRYRP